MAPRVRRFNPGRSGSTGTDSSGTSPNDPGFLNCKPWAPCGSFRQPYGVQFVEEPARQRIFVIIGGGNRNYRIIYMTVARQPGHVRGDDDNPLYYGGPWRTGKAMCSSCADGFNEDFLVHERRLTAHGQLSLVERFSASRLRHAAVRGHRDDPGAYTAPCRAAGELLWVRRGVPVTSVR